jgi:hypothetical protein
MADSLSADGSMTPEIRRTLRNVNGSWNVQRAEE